ncbi:MAG: hypothetical protein V7644_792 [Actinomycetota bacterium]
MPTADERKARNETVFRKANEEVRSVHTELDLPDGRLPFICECEDERCRTIVQLTEDEYERVRSDGTHFLLAPEHPSSTGEVVERHDGFWVAAKQGRAAAIAEASDPRGDLPLDERSKRIGENEVIYRTVNEKIEGLNRVFGTLTETMTVVCECGRIECAEQIQVEIPEYERIRADPTLFFIVRGHDEPDVERVVERRDSYEVVCKLEGPAAELAAEHDPRS